jgi:hypothetical protein
MHLAGRESTLWAAEDRGDPSEIATRLWVAGAVHTDNVLHLGCGRGALSIVLARAGRSVIAYEEDPTALLFAADRLLGEEETTRERIEFRAGALGNVIETILVRESDGEFTLVLEHCGLTAQQLPELATELVRLPIGSEVVAIFDLRVAPYKADYDLPAVLHALAPALRRFSVEGVAQFAAEVAVRAVRRLDPPANEVWMSILEASAGAYEAALRRLRSDTRSLRATIRRLEQSASGGAALSGQPRSGA